MQKPAAESVWDPPPAFFCRNPKVYLVFFILILLVLLPVLLTVGRCQNDYHFNRRAPQIVNASFLNVRSEVLLHTLEDRQIYVSAGSACSSHKRAGSPTLTAIGASKAEMESAVRFSFSEFTTLEQIEYTLDTLREVLPMLRRFTRK